jgi:hypothetical protein
VVLEREGVKGHTTVDFDPPLKHPLVRRTRQRLLYEQYVDRGRSLSDIASECGMSLMLWLNVIRRLRPAAWRARAGYTRLSRDNGSRRRSP